MKLFGESGWQGRQGRTRMPLSALRRLLFVPTPLVWRSYVHELVYEQWTRVVRRSGRSNTSIGILNYAQFVDALQFCDNHVVYIYDERFRPFGRCNFRNKNFLRISTDFLAEFSLSAFLRFQLFCVFSLILLLTWYFTIDSYIFYDKWNCLLFNKLVFLWWFKLTWKIHVPGK